MTERRELTFIADNDVRCAQWVAEHIRGMQAASQFGKYKAVGWADGPKLICGVVFNNYSGAVPGQRNIHVHIAATSPRWATKKNIKLLLEIAFEDFGCGRISAFIAKPNKRARKLATLLGFKQEGTLRKALDGKHDQIVYGLLRPECKWLSIKHSSTNFSNRSTTPG